MVMIILVKLKGGKSGEKYLDVINGNTESLKSIFLPKPEK